MPCHLMEREELTFDDIQLTYLESLFESDDFDLDFRICEQCGQLYVHCFFEISWFWMEPDEEEIWVFWVPIDAAEVEAIRQRPLTALDFIKTREHLTWGRGGEISRGGGMTMGLSFYGPKRLPEWKEDEVGERLRGQALRGETSVRTAAVPFALCQLADPGYDVAEIRKGLRDCDSRNIWLEGYLPYLMVYPREGGFVVFRDYFLYCELLEAQAEYAPCVILGPYDPTLVRDVSGPVPAEELAGLLREGPPMTVEQRQCLASYQQLERSSAAYRGTQG